MNNIDVFLDHLVSQRNAAPNTIVAYRNDLRQFREYLSDMEHPLDRPDPGFNIVTP